MSPDRVSLYFLHAAHFACHYFLLIFPTAAIAIEKQREHDFASVISLATPMYVMFALATFPAGWLGDRGYKRPMMYLFFTGCGVSAILVGLSGSDIGIMIGLAGIGLCAAIFHPVGLSMVTEAGKRTGHLLAINGVYGNLGLAAAAAATGFASELLGWRFGFLIPGFLAILVGLFWATIDRKLQQHQEQDWVELETIEKVRQTTHTNVFEKRIVLVVLVAAMFSGFVFNGATISLPKVVEQQLSGQAWGMSDIGILVAIVYTVAAFAQLPVGVMLDRFGGRRVLILIFLLQAIVLGITAQLDGFLAILALLVAVTLMFAGIPITGWLLGRYVSNRWRSRAFAAEYVLSLGMGALAVPLIAFLIRSGIRFDTQYLLFAASAVAVVVAGTYIPAPKPTFKLQNTISH